MNSVALPKATFLNRVSLVTNVAEDESIRISVNPGDLPLALMKRKRVNALSGKGPGSSTNDKRERVEFESANTVV